MSGGAKRNQDRINIIGVVVIGICAAVMVYVSIVALQAFYSNDSSDVQTMADYGGQDTAAKNLRAEQTRNITEPKSAGGGKYNIHIKDAQKLVLDGAKDPANFIPAVGRSDKPTAAPIFGRPKTLTTPPPAPAPALDGTSSGSATDGAGAGSGSGSTVQPTPTGSTPGMPPTATGAPGN